MQIEFIEIDKLIPYANNARTHSDEQIAQLAGVIQLVGFRDPVEIDENNTILVGHGRVLAGRKLNMDKVPCVRHIDMDEGKKKSYIIANNKIALNSGWDEELLKLELGGLTDIEQIATGFNADELNLLFNGWNSDIEIPEHNPADELVKSLKLIINKEEYEFAKEVVTKALDLAGIEYEL